MYEGLNMALDFFDTDEREASDIFSPANSFENEAVMVRYIENHKEEFAQILCEGCQLLEYKREYKLMQRGKSMLKDIPNIRVDMAFLLQNEGKVKWWYVEVKNPPHRTDLRNAIAQCMEYRLFSRKDAEIVLVSSVYNKIIPMMIDEYKIPISVCFLNKDFFGVYKYNEEWSMLCRK